MAYNAGNRQDVRRLEKQAKLDDAARKEVIVSLMSTVGGRQWIHDRLSTCHLFATTFSLDALETAFKEGERNQGLQILNDVMQSCPDQYVQMMREANVRHIAADSRTPERYDGDASGSDEAADPGGGETIDG